MNYYIAVDIGGTQLRAACFPSDCQTPSNLKRVATRGSEGTLLERLIEIIASVWPEEQSVARIAVAAPGPVDPYAGLLIEAPNIPEWVNVPLKKHLTEQFNTPVALGNDANLAALGEWKYGVGQGHHHLIYLTISTGIGGGVIVDDQLLLGVRGLAAELGHVTVIPDGPLCSCGQRGHLESIASGPSIARWVEGELNQGIPSILPADRPLTAKEIALAANQGDDLAKAALERAGTFIGQALANYLHIFNPSMVIIGGGVSQSGPLLLDPLKIALHDHVLSPDYLKDLTLATASLGDNVGLMGALALAQTMKES